MPVNGNCVQSDQELQSQYDQLTSEEEATLLTRGHVVRARSTAVDMYAAIDELADRVWRQVADLSERATYGRPRHAVLPAEGPPLEEIVADLGLEETG